nr:hypothetical protein [uncultured archaeon]
MGVMSCSRRNCESIMCDCYVPDIGYICNECQNEFKEISTIGNLTHTELEIRVELEEFMKTPKNDYDNEKDITADEFFRNHSK